VERVGGGAKETISLPDRLIAGIIGKGGSIIREIAARSGASVRVSQKDTITAAGERNVMIEGTPQQVATARQLVNERVQEIETDPRASSRGVPMPQAPSYTPPPPAAYTSAQPYAQPYAYPTAQPSMYSTYYSQPPPDAAAPQQPQSFTPAPPGYQVMRPAR